MLANSSSYRPEIDGLRALALIPVVLFHAGFPLTSGGYVGVDVFFVISGFLITGIILKEYERGDFSLVGFYERRARRILPALFFVMAACIPVAVWLMVPFQLKDLSQSMIATILFVSNFYFWWKSGYFEADAEQMPLLHTWSLSIEEQFYIVFPLLLLLLLRYRDRTLINVLVLLGVISLVSAEYGWREAPEANFFFPTSRAWELSVGALCAILSKKVNLRPSSFLGFFGAACILASIIFYGPETPYPSSRTLLPVVGTGLVILFCNGTSGAGRVLSLPVLRGIGLISYSAYLWHMPILAFLRIYYFGEPPTAALMIAVASTFFLAYLSWRFVEKPFRLSSQIEVRALVKWLGGFASVLLIFGIVGHLSNGFDSLKRGLLNSPSSALVIDRDDVVETRKNHWNQVLEQGGQPYENDDKRRVLIVGDSLSQDLFVAVSAIDELWSRNQFRRLALDDSCMSMVAGWPLQPQESSSRKCSRQIQRLGGSELLIESDEVVLAANWQRQTTEGALSFAGLLVSAGKLVSIQGSATFNDFSSLSFRLPEEPEDLPHFIFQNIRGKYLNVSEELREAVQDMSSVRFLDKLALLCNVEDENCNVLDASGDLMIYDVMHMTVPGVQEYGRRIVSAGWFRQP